MLSGLIEITLNRWVRGSTAATEALVRLAGKRMTVEVEGMGLCVGIAAHESGVEVEFDMQREADVYIKAGPFELLELARAESLADMRTGRVEFRGNLNVADGFSRMLKLAKPEFEDVLAGWVGNLPAAALGRTARHAANFSARGLRAMELNTAEYLTAETAVVATAEELDAFALDVEKARDDVARCEQRLVKLMRRKTHVG
jgi:ubiquinone biosynthesis protein UbiJ